VSSITDVTTAQAPSAYCQASAGTVRVCGVGVGLSCDIVCTVVDGVACQPGRPCTVTRVPPVKRSGLKTPGR
jgi:hypothetical protein